MAWAHRLGGRVDAAGLHFGAVVAGDADPEGEAGGGELGHGADLAGDDQRVAQDQQVDGQVGRELIVGAEDGGGVLSVYFIPGR